MKKGRLYYITISSFLAMLLMILDSKTVILAMSEGIDICLKTIVPSLFPFLILSTVLTGALYGCQSSRLRPISSILGIPYGCEGIFIISLLGGYPVGAKCIAQVYAAGKISEKTAARMLGFCNNAGPAFIFGMFGQLFSSMYIPWILWIIHILSAVLVGIILPKVPNISAIRLKHQSVSISNAVEQAVKTMGTICSWIVLFKVIINFADRWFLWLFPQTLKVILIGTLELSNGCISLSKIVHPGFRFILSAAMLGFGGMCVYLQAATITKGISTKYYLCGKLLHGSISAVFAIIAQWVLFPLSGIEIHYIPMLLICSMLIVIIPIFLQKIKNNSSNMKTIHV